MQAQKTAKLDVKPTIAPKNGGFLVTLAFQNSGKEEIAFSSPSVWEGRYNPIASRPWAVVSGVRDDNIKVHNKSLEFDAGFIAASALLNHGDFSGEVLRLQPGQTPRHNIWFSRAIPSKKAAT
jgi:hypothetical protein